MDLDDDDNDNDDVDIANADDGAWQTQNEQMTNQHTAFHTCKPNARFLQFII